MRVEIYTVGSYIHVIKRGARGLPIVKDSCDQERFLRLLYYMNDEYSDECWEKSTVGLGTFGRPLGWPKRKPLVDIIAFTLMPNHFHMIFKVLENENRRLNLRKDMDGVAKFMQKLCGSMSMHSNLKYKEKGSIFQGPYKSKTINDDIYLRYVAVYVMVKNTMEIYPHGGLEGAIKDFDKAWNWAVQYPFSSLGDFIGKRDRPIIEKDILHEIWQSEKEFKEFALDCLLGRKLGDI